MTDDTPADGTAQQARVHGRRARRPVTPGRRSRDAVHQWRAYRVRQRAQLEESNRLPRDAAEDPDAGAPPPSSPPGSASGSAAVAALRDEGQARLAGALTGAGPFFVGFVGAAGVLVAWLLAQTLVRLSSVITFLVVAVFLTLVLDPVVQVLMRRGMSRAAGVGLISLGMLVLFTVFGFIVVPPIASETTILLERAPGYLEDLEQTGWVAGLDEQYDLSDRLSGELEDRMNDGAFMSTVFGGFLGAAGALAGGIVGFLTALILTLYFLATLPTVKDAVYRLVPASRRPRVVGLAEEIMRRVGGYALGQVGVATINGTLSWVLLEILRLPYSVVLALAVGLLGLIPLVGATIGAVLVTAVALFQDPTKALVVVAYYLIYQQVENYVIVPRVMSRTVSVPGAVTVVAVLAGGTLLGVVGALIAIPVAAGLLLLYEEVVVPRQARL